MTPMSTDLDLAQELKQLAERVTVLEDVEALHSLRYTFHQLINDNDWDQVGGLFAPDADLDYLHLGHYTGAEAIGAFFAAMPGVIEKDETVTATVVKQYPHGHDVRVDGDRASGHNFFEAKAVFDHTAYVVAGKFIDTYKRVDGRWMFATVRLELYWMVPFDEGWAQDNRIKGPF
jgi:hypothetical protein